MKIRFCVSGLLAMALAAMLVSGSVADESSAPRRAKRILAIKNLTLTAADDEVVQEDEEGEAVQPDRWIGVALAGVPDVLRAHLDVAPDIGLMIQHVVDESPAAKAGLQPHDVLVVANGRALKSPADLIDTVQGAEDGKIALQWLRGGKRHEGQVVAAARPQDFDLPGAGALRQHGGENDEQVDQLRAWVENLRRGDGPKVRGPLRLRILRPDVPMLGGKLGMDSRALNGLRIEINKENDEPAKIKVQKGDKTWEVTEDNLDQLPEDIRPHVKGMIGGGRAWQFGGDIEEFKFEDLDSPSVAPLPDFERQLEEMNKRMEKMFDELRQLRQGDQDQEEGIDLGKEA